MRRQYTTLKSIRDALDAVAKQDSALGLKVVPGLLMLKEDLIPLVEAIEKRERYIKNVKATARSSRDLNVLLKAIEENV